MYSPSMVVINQYFEKKRGLANGIALSGSGIGSMAIPPLMLYALDTYGLEGTLLIMAGIALNIGVCGMLFRPAKFYVRRYYLKMDRQLSVNKAVLDGTNVASGVVNAGFKTDGTCDATTETFDNPINQDSPICPRNAESPRKAPSRASERGVETNEEMNGEQHLKPVALVHLSGKGTHFKNKEDAIRPNADNVDKTDKYNVVISVINIDYHSKSGNASIADSNSKTSRSVNQSHRPTHPWFELCLLTNPIFLIYAMSITMGMCIYVDMFIMATPHAEDLGFSSTQATMVVSIMGVADTVGRVGFGVLADFNIVSKHHIFHAALGTSSVILCVIPSLKTYGIYMFVCVLFSVSAAGYLAIILPLLVETFGLERFPTAYGMIFQVIGCGHLVIPAVMGRYNCIRKQPADQPIELKYRVAWGMKAPLREKGILDMIGSR